MYSKIVLHLYSTVIEDSSFANGICEEDMKQAIECMHKNYRGSRDSLNESLCDLTDFNKAAYRCAYLYKYAPFHTALVYEIMSQALLENPYELQAVLNSHSGPLKLCSLGGGPGSDVIGVLTAMHDKFGFFPCSAKLIDLMSDWEFTFGSVIDELRYGRHLYGNISESMSSKWFDWSFLTADLQSEMSQDVTEALGAADFVTMIKFVSAAASKKTSSMIEKIFSAMKPGAFVLFVDNAGGGFQKLITDAADKCKLNDVCTPLNHKLYVNETFNNTRYGNYRSCFESRVAVQLLRKSDATNNLANLPCTENFPASSMPYWQKTHVPKFRNFNTSWPVDFVTSNHGTFKYGSPSNGYAGNFSPSASSLLISPDQKWPMRAGNQFCDSEYQNDSFDHEISWSTVSTPISQSVPKYRSNMAQNVDSGYFDESYECVNWGSPVRKILLPTPQNRSMHGKPKGKIDYSVHEDKSFEFQSPLNTSVMVQHSTPMRGAKNSFSLPASCGLNLDQFEQNARTPFQGIENSFIPRPFDSGSPFCQPWSTDCHSWETSHYQQKYKGRKNVSVFRHKPYESKKFWTRQSNNRQPSFHSSHQHRFKAHKIRF